MDATLIWGILVVLAIFGMVWPFLKVAYMSPAERLKRKHVLYLLSSGLFVTTILTVIVLNHAYTVRDGEESEEQLRKVAEQTPAKRLSVTLLPRTSFERLPLEPFHSLECVEL
jgi:hypothetical protein